MKTRTLFSLLIMAAIFSSCTTTLQQRRVADELYENPDTYIEEQVNQSGQYNNQADRSKDTLDRKDKRYGYSPYYGPSYGYIPHRWYPHFWPDWYYWDFYPYSPFYGYGYPWYGSAFYGFHSYWYSPYYRYYPYYSYYPHYYTSRSWQRKTSSTIINNERKANLNVPHTQRIRKVEYVPENKSNINSNLSIPADRKVRMPLRTIRATEGNTRVQNSGSLSSSRKRMNYIRPSNVQGSTIRKNNMILQNPRQVNPGTRVIRQRTPVYRSPVQSVNRVPQIRPSGSSNGRK